MIASSLVLTESAAWVGKELGSTRSFGKVRTEIEWEFFADNFHRFQKSEYCEADNYTSIGQFALFWNEVCQDEEDGH